MIRAIISEMIGGTIRAMIGTTICRLIRSDQENDRRKKNVPAGFLASTPVPGSVAIHTKAKSTQAEACATGGGCLVAQASACVGFGFCFEGGEKPARNSKAAHPPLTRFTGRLHRHPKFICKARLTDSKEKTTQAEACATGFR